MAGLCPEPYTAIGSGTDSVGKWNSHLQASEVFFECDPYGVFQDPMQVYSSGILYDFDVTYSGMFASSSNVEEPTKTPDQDVQSLKTICCTLHEHSINRSIRPEHALHLKFRPRLKTCSCGDSQFCSKCSLEIHKVVAECRVPAWKRLLRQNSQAVTFIDTGLDVGVLNVLIRYIYLGKITSHDVAAQGTGRPDFVYEIWNACKTVELHALYVSLGDKLSDAPASVSNFAT